MFIQIIFPTPQILYIASSILQFRSKYSCTSHQEPNKMHCSIKVKISKPKSTRSLTISITFWSNNFLSKMDYNIIVWMDFLLLIYIFLYLVVKIFFIIYQDLQIWETINSLYKCAVFKYAVSKCVVPKCIFNSIYLPCQL